MKNNLLLAITILLRYSFGRNSKMDPIYVKKVDALSKAISQITPGGEIVMANGVLLNTYGIINVDISENKFQNNRVKLVARPWGAKNNSHSNNEIKNFGELILEQNLPLKLMY